MLRGCLKIVTLKALAEGEKSGYGLMKYVGEKVGEKPSSGSMYPLLEKLESEKLVTAKKSGRSTLYRLTPQGKERLGIIESKRAEILDRFVDGMKVIQALTGEDMTMHVKMIESMKRNEVPLKEINPEWSKLREQLFMMWAKDELKSKCQPVRRVLKKTLGELKTI